jgi:hypothetical protein
MGTVKIPPVRTVPGAVAELTLVLLLVAWPMAWLFNQSYWHSVIPMLFWPAYVLIRWGWRGFPNAAELEARHNTAQLDVIREQMGRSS